MAISPTEILELARSVSGELASGSLTPACAKLYSQHTRLNAGQPGLHGWRADEPDSRLEDAVRLVQAAFIERESEQEDWYEAALRAAEILEWLSHPTLNPDHLPLQLLAAATYQLSGYPARAMGILNLSNDEASPQSAILRDLLRGDFVSLLRTLTSYWTDQPRAVTGTFSVSWEDDELSSSQLRQRVEAETASALGIICANMRWGESSRVEAALKKLDDIAAFMLNGEDRYSWLLAKLVAETCRILVSTSLRMALEWLPNDVDKAGEIAVERYFRQAYQGCKTQAWPSQKRGIERLREGGSFVLCTPTGSGKTTVAEIAILQRLFSSPSNTMDSAIAPLVMYLVPKRALAAEVEAKLQRTIAPLSKERVVITGLYGGIDWGPTDAWLTSEDRTVLICTYEKAEALIRFLGPLFLGRLALVVLDEAHMVQFDGKDDELQNAESRALRLESLIARLFVHIPTEQSRIVALSAVAAGMEKSLAKWITGNDAATPARTLYRSTRQLIGRLECRPQRRFEIRYDLLDRASLRFEETGEGGTPYIPEPFPPYPSAPSFESAGPEKKLRPYLFWAAMNLVAPKDAGQPRAILISIPQKIGGYAQDLLDLLENDWAKVKNLPVVFTTPLDPNKRDKWERCLRSCEDYFGKDSREYRLLEKGIVVHHGKMPGLMARLLVQLVDEGIVHLILATSTLSEGVNLPFEVVLLPTLRRGKDFIKAHEIANLAGRAGRPGHGTEGRALVLLPAGSGWSENQLRQQYESIIKQLEISLEQTQSSGGNSALARLLVLLWTQWQSVSNSQSQEEFLKWLEITVTVDQTSSPLTDTLDSLDSVLLSAIVELESFHGTELPPAELEQRIIEIWSRCYAHYTDQHEATLGEWFARRGLAIVQQIYPDAERRRRLYRSGLPPRQGDQLLALYPKVRDYLKTGTDYAAWNSDERFEFIKGLVELLSTHPRFALATKTPTKSTTWQDILRWWLEPNGPVPAPGAKKVSDWYDYVSANFTYRFAWGIGCILAIAADEAHGGKLQPTTLESWDDTGLPWIALWLKELVVWGTLDPVTAYLLGRGLAGTRSEASALAANYFAGHSELSANEQLNPSTIRDWADAATKSNAIRTKREEPELKCEVEIVPEFPAGAQKRWRVLAAKTDGQINWVDQAGYLLAVSDAPTDWTPALLENSDFFLNIETKTVNRQRFL